MKTMPIDAIEFLMREHNEIEAGFSRFAQQPNNKSALLHELMDALKIHARLEEELFYPTVRRLLSGEVADLVDESIDEHGEVEMLIKQLGKISLEDEKFNSVWDELVSKVERHIDEEETEMFSQCRERMGSEQLEELGARMSALRETLRGSTLEEPSRKVA